MKYKKKIKVLFSGVAEFLKRNQVLTKLYNIISIIATLTIFSGLILFLYGRIVKSNQSDNDLIMKQIKKEIGNDDIISLNTVDIHGFGNNSIIVTTSSNQGINNDSNNLLILDVVNNEILKGMNDLFGTKSSYKTTFKYTLSSENIQFVPKVEYVLDILGDSTKEVIVKYYIWGSNYGANGTAIFAYSYEDEAYRLLGTYPDNVKLDLNIYDNDGKLVGKKAQIIESCFHKTEANDSWIQCSDGKQEFNLNDSSIYSREYWIDSTYEGQELVTVNTDYDLNLTYINVYKPYYDSADDTLAWNMLYSEYVSDFPRNYTQNDLAKTLMDIMDSQIVFLDAY